MTPSTLVPVSAAPAAPAETIPAPAAPAPATPTPAAPAPAPSLRAVSSRSAPTLAPDAPPTRSAPAPDAPPARSAPAPAPDAPPARSAPAIGARALPRPTLAPVVPPAPSGIRALTGTESDELYLIPWEIESDAKTGHDPRSAYVEHFWLGTLGPSTTWFLRYCAAQLDGADGAAVELNEVAARLGIGHRGGTSSPMSRAVVRACRFRAARPAGPGTLAVRRRLPTLNRRQIQRLSAEAQRRHELFMMAATAASGVEEQRRKARRLALGLIECGDGYDDAELQLGRWRFHPAMAAEAVRWAWQCHHGGPVKAPSPLIA